MDAKKLTLLIVMIAIVAVGAGVLRSAVSKSERSYRADQQIGGGIGRNSGNGGNGGFSADQPSWSAAPPEIKAAATKVIVAQLDAFKRDDYADAMTYQSILLRSRFSTPSSFRFMIQHGYPEFARYKSVTFGATKSQNGQQMLAVQITLEGEDNITVQATYFMRRENGAYRVAGVGAGQPSLGGMHEVQPKQA